MMNEEVWGLVVFALLNGRKADRQKAWEQLTMHNMEVNEQNRRELVADMQERHEQELTSVREMHEYTISMLRQDCESYKASLQRIREAWAQNGLQDKIVDMITVRFASKKEANSAGEYISQIKQLREVTGFGLAEAKDAIDRCYAAREAKRAIEGGRHIPELGILA